MSSSACGAYVPVGGDSKQVKYIVCQIMISGVKTKAGRGNGVWG